MAVGHAQINARLEGHAKKISKNMSKFISGKLII